MAAKIIIESGSNNGEIENGVSMTHQRHERKYVKYQGKWQ